MPKARKKKNSSFQTTITKSVFLYGRPNKEKLAVLRQMQNSYTALINRDIELLEKNPDIVLQLVKNDKKDPQMRKLEKAIRPEGINSAFCQNAFDAAVVQVSGHLNNIRLDLLSEGMGIFAQSKVLFAMSVMGCSKQKMEETMRQIEGIKLNFVNQRREFFNVSLDEIKQVIKDNYDKSVEFVELAPAEQYRESLKLKEQAKHQVN